MDISLTQSKLEILRLLGEKPEHGYKLAKRLNRHQSTIYQHLNQMEEAGLVQSNMDGRRKVYHLTQKGELILNADKIED